MLRDDLKKELDFNGPDSEFFSTEEEYRTEIENGIPIKVYRFGVNELDTYCPSKSGQLTICVGHTNVGKSTFVMWFLVLLAKTSDLRFVIYSAENRISAMVKRCIQNFFNKPYGMLNQNEISLGYTWVNDHFRFIKHSKMYTYLELLNIFLKTDFNYDGAFIDPYNSLRLNLNGLGKHDYNIQACEEMRVFCASTNKQIYLNCHTTTEAQRTRDKDGNTVRPLYTDVEGGAPFGNKADDAMVIHRNVRDPYNFMITELYIDKIREQEYGGKITGWSSPIKFRFRKDRTGFDLDGSFESKITQYKEVRYNPSIEPQDDLPF